MLYGNIIFIKKTGGDGSKYPVSEKSVKIGRSEDCLIRIYNTQVALEHCQLIIGENGQATLKDLSNQTLLNGNILNQEEATLCHGDTFKVGERLARWEYLPTSKYYRQLLSPTGRLVAVVMPQQRCLEDQSSGTSASFVSVLKNTPVGGKRRYSERFASENTSAVKMRKSSSLNHRKTKGDLSKLLTGRHSLKTKKLLLPVSKIKDRKSTSGIISAKTPKGKSRKSTLPSWKVNIVSPPTKKAEETSLSINTPGKSSKSSKNRDKSLLKDTLDPESEKLSVAKKRVRSPQKTTVTSEEIVKSTSKNVLKIPVKPPVDSPLKIRGSTRGLSKSPSSKRSSLMWTPSPKPVRLIHSERKPKSSVGKSSANTRESKRLSLVLRKVDIYKRNKRLLENFSNEELNNLERAGGVVSDINPQTTLKYNKNKGFPGKRAPVDITQISPLNELDDVIDSKNGRQVLHFQNKSGSKSTPLKKTPKKLEKSVGKLRPTSSRKNLVKSPSGSGTAASNSASARSPKSSSVRISLRKTINLSKERISSPRGVRRKRSPSISSAERAAKKLKTSSPKKPDKNKKAALLVLGKANRKQLLAQNVKVFLKQKIVKKAIKQSTTANTEKIDNSKKKSLTAAKNKPKKGFRKNSSKAKKKSKKKNDPSKGNTPANSLEVPQSKDEMGCTSKSENTLEGNMLRDSNAPETSPRFSSKFKNSFTGTPGKTPSIQHRKSESPRSILSKETSSPFTNFEKVAENFVFNSNRRCSKRLSSKNDSGRPDFVELSPTALGLIPKNIEVFKTPKQNKRRSSSLVTPKVMQSIGIIKSASTSKIGSRKNVRFSSKDMSLDSEFCSPIEKTDFDLGAFKTPDVSVDMFISPLGDKTSGSKKGLDESSRILFASEDDSDLALAYRSNSEPRKCIRKLLPSPRPKSRVSSNKNELLRGSRSSTVKVHKERADSGTKNSERNLNNFELEVYRTPKINLSHINGVLGLFQSPKNDSTDIKGARKLPTTRKVRRNPKNDLSDLRGVKKLLATPKVQKSPKNDLSDVKGVKKLLATPKVQKSPKNDLSDVRGVKKLLATPKVRRSPKNDLSDVKGVKKLLTTPKVRRSPKNDLSDVRGVKKLLATPKVQKSPKNDLSDVKGVKKLLATPKVQKSPKNDLSDVKGVKKLLTTPKVRRSPKNDLSDVRGVKKLLATPKVRRSPKNDLSDVKGVKKLLTTPKVQKSPKNDLSDVRGVKKLLTTPKVQKSPKNDLSDVRGVKKLLTTPKVQKSPKNDLSDVRGVRKLLGTPKMQKNPKNDLTNVAGVKELFRTPRVQKTPKNDLLDVSGVQQLFGSPKQRSVKSNSTKAKKESTFEFLEGNLIESRGNEKLTKDFAENSRGFSESCKLNRDAMGDISNVDGAKQALGVGKRRSNVPKNKSSASRKSCVSEVRAIKRGRSNYSTSKEPKNDLSDVTGVRELFARHKPTSDFNESLTGVSQLFNLAEEEVVSTRKGKTSYKKSTTGAVQKVPKAVSGEDQDGHIKTRRGTRGVLRKASAEEPTRRSVRGKKPKTDEDLTTEIIERKPTIRKAAERTKPRGGLKSPAGVKRSERIKKGTKRIPMTSQVRTKAEPERSGEIKTRKRKAAVGDAASPPLKLRRKGTEESVKKATSRSKTALVSSEKISVKTVRKVSARVKNETSKSSSKVQTKRSKTSAEGILKVQKNRSQSNSKKNLSESEEKFSPIKTRSAKREAASGQNRVGRHRAPAGNETSKSTAGRKKIAPVVKRSTRRK